MIKWLVGISMMVFLAETSFPRFAQAQAYNWSGLYVGMQAGFAEPKDVVTYGGSSTGAPFNDPNEKIVHREHGFTGGAQAGYNHQLGWFVPGFEMDLGYLRFNGSRPSPFPNENTVAVSTGGLFGTVTGRLGVAIDRALLYAKGGFAYADLDLGVTDKVAPLTTDATSRTTRIGWTIGGGIEYGISQKWTIKTEYQFVDLGRQDVSAVASDGIADTWRHDVSAHVVKVGLNYKF
jgi:outer membrane immunogenic protein